MNVSVLERDTAQKTKLTTVDCDVHPTMKSPAELRAFLPERWRAYQETYGSFLRTPLKQLPNSHFKMQPDTARTDAWPPNGGPPGSDVDFMREQHLDPNGIEYGILIPLGSSAGSQRNFEYGAALASAMNDWQAEMWLAREPRFRGSIMVTPEDTAAAIREIERCAADGRFVQVFVPPRTYDPLGTAKYWPLFDAVSEMGLPLALHVGGTNGNPRHGAGWPSFYIEDHQTNTLIMQGVLSSFVLDGALQPFPKLRVVMVEGGFAWAPALAWRLDKTWSRMRDEVPKVKRPPSEYIREQTWFTTQPVDEPVKPVHLNDIMEWIGWDRLLFSTDYPHWDFDDPERTFRAPLDPAVREMIFRGNAKALYRLD